VRGKRGKKEDPRGDARSRSRQGGKKLKEEVGSKTISKKTTGTKGEKLKVLSQNYPGRKRGTLQKRKRK